MNWNPDNMDRLERAITEGSRIQVMRRGTEYVLLPRQLRPEGSTDVLLATTTTGDDLNFALNEIERFAVLG
jgi:hypothetical protein